MVTGVPTFNASPYYYCAVISSYILYLVERLNISRIMKLVRPEMQT